MGTESRARPSSTQAAALQERMLGPIQENGYYDTGCPKCGCPKFEKGYCIGKVAEDQRPPEARCHYDGEHLHGRCMACSFGWIERCKDWREIVAP